MQMVNLDGWWNRVRKELSARNAGLDWLGAITSFLLIYILAGLYRWSLKSTALIWSPLVWAFRPIRASESTLQFVRGLLTLSIYRFARWYSGLVLILFAGKFYIWLTWIEIAGKLKVIYGWSLISSYLLPESIPLWHLSAVANGLLTWMIYFRAERYLHLVNSGVAVSDNAMDRFLTVTFYTRNVLSIYTAICTLYITKELAGIVELPTIRLIGFPW
jgi:hypothetical protein